MSALMLSTPILVEFVLPWLLRRALRKYSSSVVMLQRQAKALPITAQLAGFGGCAFRAELDHCTLEARKLEHGFRRISARIPYTLPLGHEDDVSLLCRGFGSIQCF